MTTRKADSVNIVAWLLSLLNGGDEWGAKSRSLWPPTTWIWTMS